MTELITDFMDTYFWELVYFIMFTVFSYVAYELKLKYENVIDTKEKKETCNVVVNAVEQIAKVNGWTGEKKKSEAISYVVKMLNKKGLNIDTEEINLMIEAAVNGLSEGAKKVETKEVKLDKTEPATYVDLLVKELQNQGGVQ